MIERHYFPSWCGDYRLEADSETSCLLVVTDPTAAEQEKLERFLEKCMKHRWVKPFSPGVITANGTTKIKIAADVATAGRALLARKGRQKRTGILTAVKSINGVVTAVEGEEKVAEAVSKPEAKEAVTTRRPTLSCPHPISGPDIRASNVLMRFCTPQQWDDWMRHGYLRAFGRFSGHQYRIAHRHSELARSQGKITWDETDDHVVHCYDVSMPPAEEVLAVKLALEHAEHWVRNRSGLFYRIDGEALYVDPFVGPDRQSLDGTKDNGRLRGFGMGLRVGLQHGMAGVSVLFNQLGKKGQTS